MNKQGHERTGEPSERRVGVGDDSVKYPRGTNTMNDGYRML
jgi:hypothetical protein